MGTGPFLNYPPPLPPFPLLLYYPVRRYVTSSTFVTTVLPPNSRFLGPGIFREFEIRELIIHYFPSNSLYYY